MRSFGIGVDGYLQESEVFMNHSSLRISPYLFSGAGNWL